MERAFPDHLRALRGVDPAALKWLLDHRANPNCGNLGRSGHGARLLNRLVRASPRLGACIDTLLDGGGVTKYDAPAVLDLLRGRLDRFAEHLDADPALVDKRFPELDCDSTGARLLRLQGATLLHVAAEYCNLEAAMLLLDRGAQVDARATVDEAGIGGQTAIFHAVTQFGDRGLPVAQLLVERGADLSVRVKLPGHYERPGEVVECTPLGYALRFPGVQRENHDAVGRARGCGVTIIRGCCGFGGAVQ